MKNVSLALFVLTLLSCRVGDQGFLAGRTGNPDVTAEMISFLLSEKPEGADEGLFLYRNPTTRFVVEDFYAGVTADRGVTHAILTAAEVNDIPLPLAFSVAWVESEYRVRAVNHNARSLDRGLFQLNSRTFPYLQEEEFFNPLINARHGLSHLRFCLKEGQNEVVALAMYNAGTQRVRSGTPYTTLHYVARALAYRQELEESFGLLIQQWGRLAESGGRPPADS